MTPDPSKAPLVEAMVRRAVSSLQRDEDKRLERAREAFVRTRQEDGMKKKTLRVMLEQERVAKDVLLEAKAELEARVQELERALCKLSAEHRERCPTCGEAGPHTHEVPANHVALVTERGRVVKAAELCLCGRLGCERH